MKGQQPGKVLLILEKEPVILLEQNIFGSHILFLVTAEEQKGQQ